MIFIVPRNGRAVRNLLINYIQKRLGPDVHHSMRTGSINRLFLNILLMAAGACLGAVLFLTGFEISLRSRVYYPHLVLLPGEVTPPPTRFYETNDELGWIHKRNFVETQRSESEKFSVECKINSEGFRERHSLSAPKKGRRILVLGDSMTYGFGVEENARFTDLAEKALGGGYEIVNISALGWGFDQMVLAFKHYAPLAKADLVVIAYIHNDLFRCLYAYGHWNHQKKKVFEVKTGRLVERLDGPRFVERLLRKSHALDYLYGLWFRQNQYAELSRKLADAAADFSEKNKIPVVFLQIPEARAMQPDLPPEERRRQDFASVLLDYLQAKGYKAIHPIEEMEKAGGAALYFPENQHLNAAGHAAMAEVLKNVIVETLESPERIQLRR